MSIKYRTSAGTSASNFSDLVVKVGDTLPIGTEVDYNGQTAPAGWEEVDDPNTYSTTETKIGTWIDGKPIYRKVVTLPNDLTINAEDWAGTSLPSNNIETIINGLGIKSGNATSQIRVQASADALSIMNPASSFSIVIKNIVIEYTKTTD